MGLPAMPATNQTQFAMGDIVIRGYLFSIEAGSAAERVAIGMGKGAAELKVAAEGFQVTPTGMRKLGSGTLDTKSSKTPGAAVPLAVAVATKNPLGLIVSTGVKLHDEADGSATIEGKAKGVAKNWARSCGRASSSRAGSRRSRGARYGREPRDLTPRSLHTIS